MAIDTTDLVIIAEGDATSESGGAWGGATPAVDNEVFREATGSISSVQRKASGFPGLTSGTYWAKTSAPWISLSNKILYIWLNHSALAYLDTKQNGGIRIWLQDSSARNAYWYVDGKDTYFGGFKCYALDCDTTPSSYDVGFDKTNIKSIGFIMQVTGAARNATNTWVDIIRYTDKTTGGVTVYGGTGGSPSSFQELIDDEQSTATGKAYGILRYEGGAMVIRGRIKIGLTAGTTPTYFKSTSQVLIWTDATYYLPGTGLVPMLSTAGNGIDVRGISGTYPTTFYFGNSSGSGDTKVGVSGCFLKAAGDAKFTFTITDAYVTVFGIYGSSFINASTISFPVYDANKDVLNCSFEGCGEVQPNNCLIRNCNFIASPSTTTGAIMLDSNSLGANIHTTYCKFISCSRGIRFPTGSQGSYSFTSMSFTGCTVDIRNEVAAGQTVTINKDANSNPSTHEEPNGGTTTFVGSVPITITCKNEAGNGIYQVRVRIEKVSDGSLVSQGYTNASGVFTDSYTGSTPLDVKVIVRLKGYKFASAQTAIAVGTGMDTPFTMTADPAVNLP
jgi:hypothetical protein